MGVSDKRSRQMAAVRSRGNKSTERRLRYALVSEGVSGWTLHPRMIPGNPDFFFPREGLAVFVDGCFWHGCIKCGHLPRTRARFWKAKIARNRARDTETVIRLRSMGYRAVRFWEHELEVTPSVCVREILKALCPQFRVTHRSPRTRSN